MTRRLLLSALLGFILASSALLAATEPPEITVVLCSHEQALNISRRVAGSAGNLLLGYFGDVQTLPGFDAGRPLVFRAALSPDGALAWASFIPVSNFDAFSAGLKSSPGQKQSPPPLRGRKYAIRTSSAELSPATLLAWEELPLNRAEELAVVQVSGACLQQNLWLAKIVLTGAIFNLPWPVEKMALARRVSDRLSDFTEDLDGAEARLTLAEENLLLELKLRPKADSRLARQLVPSAVIPAQGLRRFWSGESDVEVIVLPALSSKLGEAGMKLAQLLLSGTSLHGLEPELKSIASGVLPGSVFGEFLLAGKPQGSLVLRNPGLKPLKILQSAGKIAAMLEKYGATRAPAFKTEYRPAAYVAEGVAVHTLRLEVNPVHPLYAGKKESELRQMGVYSAEIRFAAFDDCLLLTINRENGIDRLIGSVKRGVHNGETTLDKVQGIVRGDLRNLAVQLREALPLISSRLGPVPAQGQRISLGFGLQGELLLTVALPLKSASLLLSGTKP